MTCENRISRVEYAVLTFRDGQSWTPLVSKNVQAYTAVRVDVWVVNPSREVYFRWLEWIVCGEMDREEENTAGVWTITLSSSVRPGS